MTPHPPSSRLWNYASLLLWGLVLPLLAGFYPIVRFTQEQIDVEVHPDHVEVTGWYVYKNPFPFPVAQGFSVPLPIDSDHPPPSYVSAYEVSADAKPIRLRHLLGKYRFELYFAAGEERRLRLNYRQQAPAQSSRYILKTTRPWRAPLRRGVYRLFPRGVTVISSSYPLGSLQGDAIGFVREDFLPTDDWRLTWRIDS
jgi:hypothetical protein